MRCEDLPVTDVVDGTLPPGARAAAEAHLAACPACRALVADLRAIRAAAFTLDRREPPAGLLARIEAHRAVEGRGPRGFMAWPVISRAWRPFLAAAATLILATGVALVPLIRSSDDGPASGSAAPALVDAVQADLRAAEVHYDKAIRGLEQIARTDTGVLDPQVAAVLQKNLQVVDQAIDESRAALRVQPASATAQDGLFSAMRTKVALLQQTVELINEMRKGNQAEAGRLMQDFSR